MERIRFDKGVGAVMAEIIMEGVVHCEYKYYFAPGEENKHTGSNVNDTKHHVEAYKNEDESRRIYNGCEFKLNNHAAEEQTIVLKIIWKQNGVVKHEWEEEHTLRSQEIDRIVSIEIQLRAN